MEYGLLSNSFDMMAGPVFSSADLSLTDQVYSIELAQLDAATSYYLRVVATFDVFTLYSEVTTFTTIEQGKQTQ